jgi:hypothetical protein
MAMRVAAMSPLHAVEPPQVVRESDSLLRKLILLLLLISAAALWIVIWFRQDPDFPLLLSTFFADASLGLVAGFGSRIFLRKRDAFVRYAMAITVMVAGMYLIGALTQWVLGVGPIRLEERFAEQVREVRLSADLGNQIRSLGIGSRVLFDLSSLDWADPLHLAVSLVMTLLALSAWHRSQPAAADLVEVEVAPLPVPAAPRIRTRRGRRSSSASNGRARVRRIHTADPSVRPSLAIAPRILSENGSRPALRSAATKVKEPTLRPRKKRLSRRKPKIHFAMVEEHRCPYCLETVVQHDPRGVKECNVCHTWHHADCWSITGVCQVPHLNT